MNLDTERATFVQQEYRYATASDATVLARNPSARVVEIASNLDASSAAALASKYLAENDAPRGFEVVLQGTTLLSQFVGGPPTFIADFPRFATDGRVYKVVGFTTDFDANTTTLQVRG